MSVVFSGVAFSGFSLFSRLFDQRLLGEVLDWFVLLNPYLTSLVLFLLILSVGIMIGKIVGKIFDKGLNALGADLAFKKAGFSSATVFIGRFFSWLIYITAFFVASSAIGLFFVALNIVLSLLILAVLFLLVVELADLMPDLLVKPFLPSKRSLIGRSFSVEGLDGLIIDGSFLGFFLVADGEIYFLPNLLVWKAVRSKGRK